MTPRALLGLSLGLFVTAPFTVLAADPSPPPLEGGPSPSSPAPASAPPPPGAATPPAPATSPQATAPAATGEAPAATAAAPNEPPPPVYEAESEFPEPATTTVVTNDTDDLGGDAAAAKAKPKEAEGSRRLWEINLGLGFGNAACDRDGVDSLCPVNGAFTGALGGGYRFVPNFSVGLEYGFWGYSVKDGWQGRLGEEPDDTEVSSGYLAVYGRWYWFDKGKLDPYLQAGIGWSLLHSKASKADYSVTTDSRGWAIPVGVGVDWQLGKIFRLGPQALVYWHHSTEICTSVMDVEDGCRDPGEDADGHREGEALPWRVTINGTFTLGAR